MQASKKVKNLLAVILALFMAVAMVPMTAFAEEGAEAAYTTDGGLTWNEVSLVDAVWDCLKPDTKCEIKLLRDVTLTGNNWSEGLTVGYENELTLDGQGYTLTRGDGIQKVMTVAYGANVTFKNITIDGGAIWSGDDPAQRENTGLSFSGNAHLIHLYGDATLTLEDGVVLQNSSLGDSAYGAAVCVGDGTGSVGTLIMKSGSEICGNEAESGGAIYVWPGCSFTMEGGEVHDNYASSGGGAICNQGEFSMENGEITNNASGNNGGGVCINGGNFTMTGGSISDNQTTVGGGGVTVLNNNATFTMSGGEISNNTITDTLGGGVLVNGGTFKLSGSPQVTDNTSGSKEASNVYLKGAVITVAGTVTEGAKIGVTTTASPNEPFVSGWSDYMTGKAPEEFFVSDNAKYGVSPTKDGKEAFFHEHVFENYAYNNDATCVADGTETGTCKHCTATDTRLVEGTKLEHDWEEDFTIDKEATATEDGLKSIHCKNCEATKDKTVIPATGAVLDPEPSAPSTPVKKADYSKVDAAIAQAQALNKEDFVDFSAVEEAINAVVRNKTARKQAEVDAMAQAILDAMAALEKAPGPQEPASGDPTGPDAPAPSEPDTPSEEGPTAPTEPASPAAPQEPGAPGEATEPAAPNAPKTGDSTGLSLWLLLLAAGGLGLFAYGKSKKSNL